MKRGLPARLSFLDFLCETRYQEEQSDPSICSTKFHLGFHLTDKAKSVLITAGTVNKNIVFLPSQYWDIVSILCIWAKHLTLKCFT